MMFRHSYIVEIKRLEAKIKGLEMDLLKNPDNVQIKSLLSEAKQSLDWFKKKINEGKGLKPKIL